MSDQDEHGRVDPPSAGDEVSTLLGYLDYQRATFNWKCAGLDAAGMRASLSPTTMTLGGMMKHLALVEDYWFSQRLLAREMDPRWAGVDFDADPDWEWRSAAEDSPEELLALWQSSVAIAQANVAAALAEGGLDRLSRRRSESGFQPSLRWITVHMIEEYARHNGHADLLRESIDGATGE